MSKDIFSKAKLVTLSPEQKDDLHRRGLLFEDFHRRFVVADAEAYVVKSDAINAFVRWRQDQRESIMPDLRDGRRQGRHRRRLSCVGF